MKGRGEASLFLVSLSTDHSLFPQLPLPLLQTQLTLPLSPDNGFGEGGRTLSHDIRSATTIYRLRRGGLATPETTKGVLGSNLLYRQ